MISQKLQQVLNEQMNHEFESAYLYLAMACDAEAKGFKGTANWLTVQYEEELLHSFKIRDFLMQIGCRPVFTGVTHEDVDYQSIKEIFEAALEAEKKVTGLINEIMHIAVEEHSFAVKQFISWYVDEQVEEEANVNEILDRIKLYTDANILLLDNELAGRTLTALV